MYEIIDRKQCRNTAKSARKVNPSYAVLSDASHTSLVCYMSHTVPEKAAVLSPGAS